VYYLDGVSLEEAITITVDWHNHQPGSIRWITPVHTYEDPITGSTITRSFDMGNDFGPNGTLRIVAIADNGTAQSTEYIPNMKVVSPPSFVNWLPSAVIVARPNLDVLQYEILGLESASITLAEWEEHRIPGNVPFFGGKKMKIGAELDLSGTVKSDGTADLFSLGIDSVTKRVIRKGVPCRKGMKLPFVELGPNALSCLDFRVDGLQLTACVVDFHSPVDASLRCVDVS
jgi:hypothetical protein